VFFHEARRSSKVPWTCLPSALVRLTDSRTPLVTCTVIGSPGDTVVASLFWANVSWAASFGAGPPGLPSEFRHEASVPEHPADTPITTTATSAATSRRLIAAPSVDTIRSHSSGCRTPDGPA
jgi:hypothetical protein